MALAVNPNSAVAFSNCGNALQNMEQYDAAVDSYNKAIAIIPDYPEAFYNRGNALQSLKKYEAAVDSYDKAIALKPDYAEAYSNRGNALLRLSKCAAAVDDYDRAIAIKPEFTEAYSNRSNALQILKQHEAAVGSCDKAIALKPDYAEAYSNRGNALQRLKQYEAAVDSYDKAITLKPDYAEAYSYRGNALQRLKQFEAAVDSYDKAIAINSDSAEVYSNRGNALLELNLHEAALASCNRAVAISPFCVEALYNCGNALHALKQYEDAIASYETAIVIDPDCAEAHWNQSLCYLQTGNFLLGWEKYEWRLRKKGAVLHGQSFSHPLWLGQESLQGKSILLHCEQGLGDTLQFCRYAKLVSNLGASVILEVQKPLQQLLGCLEGVSVVLPEGNELPPFDYHCYMLSLPLAFKTTIATIPPPAAIKSEVSQLAKWQARLGGRATKPYIGLVWSGNAAHQNDHNRSIPLEYLVKYLPGEFQYVSLQKEVRDTDRAILQAHPEILHFDGQLEDFTDTAALCTLMDLVLSVDSSVAHLAGSLSKPLWLLLPFNADWRWFLERSDCPWYPTAKLYRQETIAGWGDLLKRVQHDLLVSFCLVG